jgi:membrane-bound serine protease (ClpP class)
MMFDRTEPMLRLSLAVIIPATALTAAFFVLVVGAGLRAQYLPRCVGVETLIGQTVPVLDAVDAHHGKVFVEGEYWDATSEQPVGKDAPVEIVQVVGLTLRVRPKTQLKGG